MTSKIIIQIDEGNFGSESEISLKKVRSILRHFQSDVYEYNQRLDKNRLGKILTIVDSAISDETQRKAMKDLINDSWWSHHHSVEGFGDYPRLEHATQAIGFDLYEPINSGSDAVPAVEFNRYKEIAE
jgi:hypothetical protein